MDPVDLEHLIDRELAQLPTPVAPGTLLPRVLAATVRRPVTRRASGWLAWPHAWQVASVAVLAALAAGLWLLFPFLQHTAAEIAAGPAAAVSDRIRALAETAQDAAALVRLFWRVLVEPLAFYLLILAVCLSLACAVIWAALESPALGGASHQ
jgi:hypothetical protein